MRPPASKSSVLSGFADASDTSDDLAVATMLPRIGGSTCDNARQKMTVATGADAEFANWEVVAHSITAP